MSMSMVQHQHHHHARGHEHLQGNPGAAQRSERADARAERRSGDEDRRPGRSDGAPPRGNALVGALMKALQGLMTDPPADAVVNPPTPATATATGAGELKEAAYAFANELFGALRGVGGEHGDDDGRGRGHGHGHGFGHLRHGWQHASRRDDDPGRFGGLVERLQALANRLAPAAPAAAPSSDPAPAGPAPVTLDAPDLGTPSTSVPVAAAEAVRAAPTTTTSAVPNGGPTVNLSITVQPTLGQAETAPGPGGEPASPLLSAFQQLMGQLSPSAAASAVSPEDATARLKTFLLDMASALSAGGQRGTDPYPPLGGLVNVSA